MTRDWARRLAWPRVSAQVALALSVLAIALIGWADYATGIEIRIYTLYFAPLAMISAHAPRRRDGVIAAAACTAVWLFANWHAGMSRYPAHVNLVNTVVQFSAFALVAFLISRYKDALSSERALARSDALTGLLNLLGFTERANIEIARCRRGQGGLALALLDLDSFKQVNDTHGHAMGDDMLRAVGGILRQRLRRTDVAARLGGDEFAILMPDTRLAGAEGLLESIRVSVADAARFRDLPVTASIGLSMFSDPVPGLETMLRDTDQRMYDAKLAGRNRVVTAAAAAGATRGAAG